MKTTNLTSVLLTIMMLTACATSTPTVVDVNAVQTAAVQTIVANITQTAAAQPTLVPTETLPPVSVVATETVTPTLAVSSTVVLCDNSVWISDASVPDGSLMTAGQDFVKTWKVKNTGACPWKTGYQLIYAYGEKMGGLPTVLTTEVLPGSEVEISVNLKAPVKTGTFGGYWRLANNNGVPFGQNFSVIIAVP